MTIIVALILLKNLVKEIETKYCTRSSYDIEKDDDGYTMY